MTTPIWSTTLFDARACVAAGRSEDDVCAAAVVPSGIAETRIEQASAATLAFGDLINMTLD